MKLNAKASAEDGAFPPILSPLVPNIDWDIDFQVDASSNPLNPKIRSIGKKDLYPAYEIIVSQSDSTFKDIHRYTPAAGAKPGPISLNNFNAVNIERSDTISN